MRVHLKKNANEQPWANVKAQVKMMMTKMATIKHSISMTSTLLALKQLAKNLPEAKSQETKMKPKELKKQKLMKRMPKRRKIRKRLKVRMLLH